MKRTANSPITRSPILRRQSVCWICRVGGRTLLALTALLLAVMPLTEHYWTFDGLIPGGQDFELTMLAVLAVACLVLLLAQSLKEKLALLIELQEWLAGFCGRERRHRTASRPGAKVGVPEPGLNCASPCMLPALRI